jgi:hypothetical protein
VLLGKLPEKNPRSNDHCGLAALRGWSAKAPRIGQTVWVLRSSGLRQLALAAIEEFRSSLERVVGRGRGDRSPAIPICCKHFRFLHGNYGKRSILASAYQKSYRSRYRAVEAIAGAGLHPLRRMSSSRALKAR